MKPSRGVRLLQSLRSFHGQFRVPRRHLLAGLGHSFIPHDLMAKVGVVSLVALAAEMGRQSNGAIKICWCRAFLDVGRVAQESEFGISLRHGVSRGCNAPAPSAVQDGGNSCQQTKHNSREPRMQRWACGPACGRFGEHSPYIQSCGPYQISSVIRNSSSLFGPAQGSCRRNRRPVCPRFLEDGLTGAMTFGSSVFLGKEFKA